MEQKRLTRSNDRKISGVCGGIAEYFNVDPTLVRLGYALITIFTAGIPGVIAYFVAAFVIPAKNKA